MIRLIIRVSLLSLQLLLIPAFASAQRVDQLREGARVRIRPMRGREILGTVSLITVDSMTIAYEGSTQTTRVALRDLGRMQVSAGNNRLKGAVIYGLAGLAIGGLGGAAMGALAPANNGDCWTLTCRSATAFGLGIAGGFVGTLAGIAGGASKGWEGWQTLTGNKP